MKTEPNLRDVRWIAKGCWEHHYNWRTHPATKQDWLIAFIVGGIGLLVIVAAALTDCPECGVSAPAVLGFTMLIVGFIFFFIGQRHYDREKQDYIDHAIDRWESGDGALPSLESLKNWAPGFEKPRHDGVDQ